VDTAGLIGSSSHADLVTGVHNLRRARAEVVDTFPDLTNAETVDAAAEAWVRSAALLADTQPDGFHQEGKGGTWMLVTGAPFPFLNGVIGAGREPDPREIEEFAASHRLKGLPWSIQTRGDKVDDRVAHIAAEHRRTQRIPLPFMIKELTGRDLQVSPDEPKVRRITGAQSAVYQSTMAVGYEGPRELFGIFADPVVIDHPAMTAYLADADGEPAATAFGVVVKDHVGVFNVAVPPALRRRGYGRAVTAAVLRDAYAAGARRAFLHATPDGLPVYLKMGFEPVETWNVWVS